MFLASGNSIRNLIILASRLFLSRYSSILFSSAFEEQCHVNVGFPFRQLLALVSLWSSIQITTLPIRAYEQAPLDPRKIGQWGFIDPRGKIIIPPKFNSGGKFINGYADVSIEPKPKFVNHERGIINAKGECIANIEFIFPGSMNDGLAVVHEPKKLDTRTGETFALYPPSRSSTFVRADGTLFPKFFNECGSFYSGVAVVVLEKPPELLQVIPNKGTSNQSVRGAMVKRGKRTVALINKQSELIAQIPGDLVESRIGRSEVNFSNGLLPFRNKNGLVGYINAEGNVAISPRFKHAYSFVNNLAAVCNQDKLWGFVNTKGKLVIPFLYSQANDFHDGLAQVKKGKSGCFINTYGKVAFSIPSSFSSTDFSEGLVLFSDRNKRKFLTTSGKCVFEANLPKIGEFHNGLCYVAVDPNTGLYGYMNKQFRWVITPQYIAASDFSEGKASVCFQKSKSNR